ncbi:MAG: M20/M25/M40 family metallo-hydrolase, partial [Roseibium sp.]
GLPARRMPSGAGHDAQTLQGFCPAGLIFVPSRAGISHAPEEHSDWEDIVQGANLMLQALIDLSGASR